MSPLAQLRERRRRRSDKPLQALTYQLEHIYEQQDLHNFTLGDARGLVVAQAGDIHESRLLAAYAPVMSRSVSRRWRQQVLSRMTSLTATITADSIHVRSFRIDDQQLYLTLVGRPGIYRDVGLYRAITGVRRILDERSAA